MPNVKRRAVIKELINFFTLKGRECYLPDVWTDGRRFVKIHVYPLPALCTTCIRLLRRCRTAHPLRHRCCPHLPSTSSPLPHPHPLSMPPPLHSPAVCIVTTDLAAPTLPSVCRRPALCYQRALHWWPPCADEPPFTKALRRCCAYSVCCKRMFQIF